MPRHGGGGGSAKGKSGGNTRRVRKKGKNTYAAKQYRRSRDAATKDQPSDAEAPEPEATQGRQ